MTGYGTIAELIADKAAGNADAARAILTFVAVEPDGELTRETRSYAELDAHGARVAGWLAARGLAAGERVAIMMNNHPEYVEVTVAAARLGLICVPIDPRTMGNKLAYMLRHVSARGVVAAPYTLEALRAVAPTLPSLEWLLVTGDGAEAPADGPAIVRYADALAAAPHAVVPIDPTSAMSMMFTSGTTGNPKAVVQSHGASMAASMGMKLLGVREEDVIYTGLSLTHVNALATVRSALLLGIPAVISRKFTKSRLWNICRAEGCTVFGLLGGMIPQIFAAPPRADDADNPVRLIITAGMPASLWDAYRERFGVEICEVYGATEGGGTMLNLPGGRVGSMGKPDPTVEAAVFGEDGEPLPPHQPGELRFRRKDGAALHVAYFDDAEASARKVEGGWFHTGDIVHQDDEGYYYFHHRAGGGVRRNGDFVNTALVEAVMTQSPLVDDVYAFGVAQPGNVAGEKTLVALVVPSDPATFTVEALLAYCQDNLERNDVPEIIHATDTIPKTVSEKPVERDAIALLRAAGTVAA